MDERDDIEQEGADPAYEQLLPYVLGELDDEASDALVRRLATDERLREALVEVERTSVDLLTAFPRHEPAPAVKARVFDAISAAGRHDERVEARRLPGDARAGRRWRFGLWPALGTACAAASVLLLVLLVDVRGDLDATRSELEQAQRAGASEPTMRVVETSDALSVAHGMLVRTGDHFMLVFDDVPPPGDGSTWQVWTADADGEVRNVAQWSGSDTTRVLELEGVDSLEQVMVSHEHSMQPMESPSGAPMASVTT